MAKKRKMAKRASTKPKKAHRKAKKKAKKKAKNKAPGAVAMAEDKKWEREEDLRTLQRAEEIRKDPKRLQAAKKEAKEKMSALKKIEDQ